MTDTTTPLPPVVDRDTWSAQVSELRVRETVHTREGDAIAATRRRLPTVEVAASTPLRRWQSQLRLVANVFHTPTGSATTSTSSLATPASRGFVLGERCRRSDGAASRSSRPASSSSLGRRTGDERSGGPGRREQAWMVNFRVRDLDAMLAQLRAAGAQVDDNVEEYDYGRFGWATDPEGNRFELCEPKPPEL